MVVWGGWGCGAGGDGQFSGRHDVEVVRFPALMALLWLEGVVPFVAGLLPGGPGDPS